VSYRLTPQPDPDPLPQTHRLTLGQTHVPTSLRNGRSICNKISQSVCAFRLDLPLHVVDLSHAAKSLCGFFKAIIRAVIFILIDGTNSIGAQKHISPITKR
jgi:hypothetical protein